MSDRPLAVITPPQPHGDRPRFVFFNSAPEPVLTQAYGENPGDPFRRYVDIGDGHFSLIETAINSLKGTQGVAVGQPGYTGVTSNFDEFQQVRFGQPRLTTGEGGMNSFRGYIMIEPESLYDAIQRLNYVGRLRLKDGKHLEYKWLQPMVRNEIVDRIKTLGGRLNQALYVADSMTTLVTLYAENNIEIKEIFEQLVTHTGWSDIEKRKRDIGAKINLTKPQHGQVRFTHLGEEFLSLELNSQPGFAELLSTSPAK